MQIKGWISAGIVLLAASMLWEPRPALAKPAGAGGMGSGRVGGLACVT